MTFLKIEIIVFFVFFLFLTSCNTGNIGCNDLVNNYFEVTKDIKTNDDSLRFIKKIDKLLLKEPKCSKAYQIKGLYALNRGKPQLAKLFFLSAFKCDSNSIYPLYCLANLYNIDEQNDSALFFINKAIYVKKYIYNGIDYENYFIQYFDIKFNELLFEQGLIYEESGLYGKAKNDFLLLIENNYEPLEVNAHLSDIYFKLGMTDSACFFYKKARSLGNPEFIFDTSINKLCPAQ